MLDVAGSVLLAEVDNGQLTGCSELAVSHADSQELVKVLRQLGVDVVICGAVSWQLELALQAGGIELVRHICGPVEDVLKTYLDNGLEGDAFRMPGCRGQRGHNRDRKHCRKRRGGSAPV
jgi:predicted Fe-Mo cluster-binding NifX family protein